MPSIFYPRSTLMNDLIKQDEPKHDPFERVPVTLKSGQRFVLSKKQEYICQMFIETNGNISEVARRVNVAFKRKHCAASIKTWLKDYDLLAQYMQEQAEKRADLANYKPEDWQLDGIEVIKGKRKFDAVQAQVWQSYGKLVVNKDANPSISGHNVQINFLQKNGEK